MGREVKIRKINGDQKEKLGKYVEIGGAKTEITEMQRANFHKNN